MAMFSKGKKDSQQGNPVDLVVSLRQQGYPNEQIIQILQSQGFKSAQIFDSLNAADVGGVPGAPPQNNNNNSNNQFPEQQQMAQMQQMPQQQMPPEAPPYEQQSYAPQGNERTEEIVEAIIEEKWNDLLKDVNRIIEWTTRTETRISKMEQDIKNLRDNFENLHKGILGKITEYDQNLVNVGTEIKAMGKVFEKIMPVFTENVQKLSRVTGRINEPSEEDKIDIEQKLSASDSKRKGQQQ